MAPGLFTFTGTATTGYNDYRDVATGRMLVAQPGECYSIAAIDGQMAVPPGDGRWAAGAVETSLRPPPPPAVPPVPGVPDASGEGA